MSVSVLNIPCLTDLQELQAMFLPSPLLVYETLF